MKTNKLLKVRITAVFLAMCLIVTLLPAVAFAEDENPYPGAIPLTLGGEKATYTYSGPYDSGLAYFSFTVPQNGEYTFYTNNDSFDDTMNSHDNIAVSSHYLYEGNVFNIDVSILKGETISAWVVAEGVYTTGDFNKYNGSYPTDRIYWDYDEASKTLTLTHGAGSGYIRGYGNDRSKLPWYPVWQEAEHLIIGEGITDIDGSSFNYFEALKDIKLPSTLKTTGEYAFKDCHALTELTFPEGMQKIGYESFAVCTSLKKVTIQGSPTIDDGAFMGCSSLGEVNITSPKLTDFRYGAFERTPWILSLCEANKGKAIVNNVLLFAYQAYENEPGDGICIIPDGVKKIAPGAIHGVSTYATNDDDKWYLEEIVIPDSVTEIGFGDEWGFRYCSQLERITIGKGVQSLPELAYSGELRELKFGDNIIKIPAFSCQNTWYDGNLVIPDSVVSIGDKAFANMHRESGWDWIDGWGEHPDPKEKSFGNQTLTLGKGLRTIGEEAFTAWAIKDVTIPAGVKSIGSRAFINCDLKSATILNPNTVIGTEAFGFKEGIPTVKTDGFVINGWSGSTAEAYAQENGFAFQPLSGEPPQTDSYTGGFGDVSPDAYYRDAVLWAVENGITSGTSDTTFGPDEGCTRAQMATFLWRAKGQPEPSSAATPFADIKPEDYFYKAVLWAAENNIITGTTDTTFAPYESCTRAQITSVLWRMDRKPEPNLRALPFLDVKRNDYFYDAVCWGVEKEIANGIDYNTFGSYDTCTRSQIVTFIYRYIAY